MNWSLKHWNELTTSELYDIMQLRQVVFIVEQNCPYLDADGKDLKAWHLMGRDDKNHLIAHARLLPQGVSYPAETSIGRVVSHPEARGTGAGKALMTEAIRQMNNLFPGEPMRIGAQSYLIRFYESFGFIVDGPEYLEDGIPHVEMTMLQTTGNS